MFILLNNSYLKSVWIIVFLLFIFLIPAETYSKAPKIKWGQAPKDDVYLEKTFRIRKMYKKSKIEKALPYSQEINGHKITTQAYITFHEDSIEMYNVCSMEFGNSKPRKVAVRVQSPAIREGNVYRAEESSQKVDESAENMKCSAGIEKGYYIVLTDEGKARIYKNKKEYFDVVRIKVKKIKKSPEIKNLENLCNRTIKRNRDCSETLFHKCRSGAIAMKSEKILAMPEPFKSQMFTQLNDKADKMCRELVDNTTDNNAYKKCMSISGAKKSQDHKKIEDMKRCLPKTSCETYADCLLEFY